MLFSSFIDFFFKKNVIPSSICILWFLSAINIHISSNTYHYLSSHPLIETTENIFVPAQLLHVVSV